MFPPRNPTTSVFCCNNIAHRLAVPYCVDDGVTNYLNIICRRIDSYSGCSGDNHPAYANIHSPILQLPVELLLLIADELDLNSVYISTQCCITLRTLLRPEVINVSAPWANTPIIWTGPNMRSTPSGRLPDTRDPTTLTVLKLRGHAYSG